MRIKAMVLISVITSAFLFASEKAQDKVQVSVKSAGNARGFTDPSKARQDSMKDLLKKLKDSHSICPVESEKDALAVLEVLDRDTKRETNLWGREDGEPDRAINRRRVLRRIHRRGRLDGPSLATALLRQEL